VIRDRAHRTVVAVAVLALATLGAGGSTTLDFVTFDGIDYIRWLDEPGRALTREDLGLEFATVECSLTEDVRNCSYGMDAAAAFLPTGTRLYAVRGHATSFRLGALIRERVLLYQAWKNPRAKRGADLYALAGKVRAIDVQRGEPIPGGASPASISAEHDVEALMDMVLRGPVRRPQPHAIAEPRYWVTFWLSDGTTLGRAYFAETSELMGGLTVPPEFRSVLERYLAQ
jgi:hypothetical protein